jgi:hypothetical protein
MVMHETGQPRVSDRARPSGWTAGRIVKWTAGALFGLTALIFITGLLLALLSDVGATAPRIQIIRDIILIVLSLEFILIILALAILILQVARLINLLQNEIKPILENTQETLNSARGSVQFVTTSLTTPLIRAGSFVAGTRVLLRELGGIRRAIRPTETRNIEPEHDDSTQS